MLLSYHSPQYVFLHMHSSLDQLEVMLSSFIVAAAKISSSSRCIHAAIGTFVLGSFCLGILTLPRNIPANSKILSYV